MSLNNFTLFTCILLLGFGSAAQAENDSLPETPIYKRVAIPKPNKSELNILNEVGVDLTCGVIQRNDSLLLELSEYTLSQLENEGIDYTVLIEDMSARYEKQSEELPQARAELNAMKAQSRKKKGKTVLKNVGQHDDCDEIDWAVPNNFHLNPNSSPISFGGCLTYDQVLDELDSMRALYPNLISTRLDASPTNQMTLEGRTIFYVRISDNPDIDESNEPETLYQSLVHSREAGSLMQLLYFMWYVLENYDTDQDIQNLVNNQAMYFIPVFNPDGFVYNELVNPNGGGMQRKNRNIGGSGCSTFLEGIDLNRNSAYYWGNGGASTNDCSNTYLGSAPFSENETQIMRDFFLEHDFKLALNHHSYKNAMLHAYAGTNITNPRPDEYSKYNHDMTYHNRYAYGPSTSISSLNSGNMNDWMLGGPAGVSANGTPTGTGSGKNTMAWTPENGDFDEGGFWPNPSNFVIIAKRAMRANFLAAYFSGKYAKLHDLNQSEINSTTGTLNFAVENLGQTASDFEVSITPISANIVSVDPPVTVSGMSVLQQNEVAINYLLDAGIQAFDTITFEVSLSNDYASDNVLYTKTIQKIYQPNVIFRDDPDTDALSNWTSAGGSWSTTADSYSGNAAITSTVAPPYSNDESKSLELNNPLDFSNADHVQIQYYAKWDLERSFDYVQLEASPNGASWFPLCGKFTKPGAPDGNNTYSGKSSANNDFQPDGIQLYDGDTQNKWILEEIVIDDQNNSSLAGASSVYFRFVFETDGSNSQDAYYNADFEGFTFDDFACIQIDNSNVGLSEINDDDDIAVYPNPVEGFFSIQGIEGSFDLKVYNALGKLLFEQENIVGLDSIDASSFGRSLLFITAESDGKIYRTKLLK
ncbi:MAG: M14 family zinc carboxypeptidase [Crocinitomicaceae bacterium]|nr:M14 family zinc carboxypeptidase [Crocinitomicaceae bacterium]